MSSAAIAISIIVVIVGLLILLRYLGQTKFRLMEEAFAANGKDTWMPTASGRNPEGEPVGVSSDTDGEQLTAPSFEKLLASDRLVPMSAEEAVGHWSQMTSERCFRSDMAEPLRKTRNYLQRTNNYPRSHPDSCSAPNHEMIGTFYKPHEGVGAKPASGLPFPAGALTPPPCM
jgi:hypothetical protein